KKVWCSARRIDKLHHHTSGLLGFWASQLLGFSLNDDTDDTSPYLTCCFITTPPRPQTHTNHAALPSRHPKTPNPLPPPPPTRPRATNPNPNRNATNPTPTATLSHRHPLNPHHPPQPHNLAASLRLRFDLNISPYNGSNAPHLHANSFQRFQHLLDHLPNSPQRRQIHLETKSLRKKSRCSGGFGLGVASCQFFVDRSESSEVVWVVAGGLF
ncbi:hypothetical protein BZA77DRAFT_271080, partial [Pyronema omphalodes]